MTDRISITPENESAWHLLRTQDVTSTESAALFGMSPYATEFELFHRKREGAVVEIDQTGRMFWGAMLQNTIAKGIAQLYGVKVRRVNAYMRLPSRMGSSFDFEIIGVVDEQGEGIGFSGDNLLRDMYRSFGVGNLEIKNVDSLVFREQWAVNDDKSIEAPDHIEVQVQHQLHVSGRAWAAIGVLVGGNAPKILIRHRDLEVGQSIESKVRAFWQRVEANDPPPPEFPEDAAFLCKLHGYAEPGKIFDGRGNADLATLARDYQQASVSEKQAKEDKEVAKAKMLAIIGDAEKALIDGFNLSAGLVGPTRIEYARAGYRTFRCAEKKSRAA